MSRSLGEAIWTPDRGCHSPLPRVSTFVSHQSSCLSPRWPVISQRGLTLARMMTRRAIDPPIARPIESNHHAKGRGHNRVAHQADLG